jgi:hypothetical protein
VNGRGAVVPVPATDERQYQHALRQIALKGRRIGEMQAELDCLKGALARFEAACQARVSDLLAELRRLAAAAADYDRRLQRLRADDGAVDEDEPPPFAQRPPPSHPRGADPGQREEAAGGATARTAFRRLPAAEAEEAKRLYLDLAKRCHPDRARDAEDGARRQELMLRINEAWRHRDLDALRTLGREAEGADPAFAERPAAERLAWATAEVARLDDQLIDLRAEMILLRRGETHRLWRRHEAGEPVIDEIERDLEKRLRREGRRLDALIAAYRRLHDDRRPAGRPASAAAPPAPAPAAD